MRSYERSPMFSRKSEPDAIDLLIEGATQALLKSELGSEEYHRLLDKVIKLHDIKERTSSKTSWDKSTLATIGGNLLGLLMIIKHESVNVISQKALSFLIKTKI